jgi:PAS domain S-box-containing protein
MNNNLLWKLWTSPVLRRAAGPVALGLILPLFISDLLVPLGYSYGFLYTLPVLVAFFSRQRRWIMAVTLLGVAGTAVNPLLLPLLPGISWPLVLFNRCVSILMILLTGFACIQVLALVTRVRDANKDLRRSDELLEIASRIGKLGGWQVDLLRQHIHWSDEVARIHGCPRGYNPGFEEAFSYYPAEFRQPLLQAFERCIAEGRDFDLDLQIFTRDEQRRWVRVAGHALRDEQRRIIGVHGAFQDIQAEMNSRQEVLRSAERWNALADAMPLIVWTADTQGRIDFFSHQLADYLQAPVATALGDNWLNHLHPDDVPIVTAHWADRLQSLRPYEAEFRVRRHDGVYEWFLARANFMPDANTQGKWYGSAMNIDALKRLQQQTADLAQRLTNTMESVTDAIVTLDHNWRITFLNRQAEALLRRERQALLGKLLWDEFPATRNSIFETQYRRCRNEQVAVRFEAWFAPLETLFEVNTYPASDGISIYFRDITEARRLSEHMQQVQKLEALGQLTGGVAHDFNNLLTVIMGNAEALESQLHQQPQLEHLAAMITNAACRAADMTQRLLAFARKQTLEPVSANLNRLLADVEPLLRRTLGANIDIELIEAGGLWTTLVDPGQLENCVLNLAINARDAMPQGGKLTLETANMQLDAVYTSSHPELAPGQYVLLAVTDTGVGIAPELVNKVFEPFFTTKETGKGTGLGLAMVYGFVKQSNGHISVSSEQGSGTTIRIYLPRLHQHAQAPGTLNETTQQQAGRGELILLVEDDALVQQYTHSQLLQLGYRVLTANNAQEALELLQSHPGIDLLFTDIMMPGGMNGDALARAARHQRPELPVLYTSGYAENAIVHQGRLEPGLLLLSKPFRRAELADKLRQALAQRD